jgi:DNA-binding CsgD family transcriptional regulator
MDEARLKAEYGRITASLACEVTDDDYRAVAPRVESLREMARIENRSVSLYDVNRKEFLLKVDAHIALLGYGSADAPDINDVSRYHAMIHPDDRAFLYDSEIKMYEFLRAMPGAEKKNYKLVYDYRVRARDGRYVRFLHQLALFELDRNHNSWLMLVISDVLASYPEDVPPRRFLIDTRTKKECLFGENSGASGDILTKREREILSLVAEGLDSRAIADRLCVSASTVNNHRQRILEKTGARNVTQAIAWADRIGLL